MTLSTSLLRQLENPALSPNNRAELRCQVAKELEEVGNYEAARQAMGDLWQRIGDTPEIEGLEPSTAAEVLLRAGTLTGWIGSCNQIDDAQETAKNLITKSIRIFEVLSYAKKVLEAQTELAYCYWRQGAYSEARIILEGVLERLTTDSELKAKAVLRLAIVEWGAARYGLALRILTDSAPLFDKINSHSIKGGYHNQRAVVLRSLATAEQREDYLDRAFVEYTAASIHFEQAGHRRYLANVENNLGFLFYEASKFREAHQHLDRARRLMASLNDKVHTARIDETRARVFLAQGNNVEAERVARSAVRTLESGEQKSLLAEALITYGRSVARVENYNQARFAFERAMQVALQSGATSRAADAALAMVQELGEYLASDSVSKGTLPELDREMRRYEAELIGQALHKAQGSVTQAARLLGTSHQRLASLLQRRHKDLLSERTPVIKRKRSIIKK